jgi:tripartite-type tricarboxylate transporter receptor subunit TctC
MTKRRQFLSALTGAVLLPAPLGRAWAAGNYPDKPIKIIVSFPPGQASDIWCRLLARHLGEKFKQPIIVENRDGAAGQIGTAEAARAAANGYTLFLGTNGNMVGPAALYRGHERTDPVKAFAPIATFAKVAQILLASPDYAPSTFHEFIADARSRPTPLDYGSPGIGTTSHLAMELLGYKAKLKLNHIPYRGGPPAYQDLLAGRIPVMFDSTTGAMSYIKNKQIKVLAVGTEDRVKSLPNVPTIAESGYAPFDASAWAGVMAPTGTPREVVQTLYQAIAEIMARPDVVKWFEDGGSSAFVKDPDQFSAFLKSEIAKWTEVVVECNILPPTPAG